MSDRKIITVEQIKKIKQAAESVRGTADFNKYNMCYEFKFRDVSCMERNGAGSTKWTAWHYVGWGTPQLKPHIIKIIKGKMYMYREEQDDNCGTINVYRYHITDTIRTLLNL